MNAVVVGGVVVAVLGLIAAGAAPKGSGSGDPDDDSVQPWTAVMFVIGLSAALLALAADGLHRETGWPSWAVLGALGGLVALLGAWGWGVHRLTRRRARR